MRLACALLVLWAGACTEAHRNIVSDPTVTHDGGDAGSGRDASLSRDAAPDRDAADGFDGAVEAGTARCGSRACRCDDGLDNDDDGLPDGLDPECTGAYDDDESSFATGQPNKLTACRDCYWDDNSGSGDDDCRHPTECLTDPSFIGKGNCSSCEVGDSCVNNCQVRTPNGCDCFGCCEVATPDGERVRVQLVESCSLAHLDDRTTCPRCELNQQCNNPCGRCELCLGKTLADLPADCGGGDLGYECEDGPTVCSPSRACPPGYYCHQGCCLVDLL